MSGSPHAPSDAEIIVDRDRWHPVAGLRSHADGEIRPERVVVSTDVAAVPSASTATGSTPRPSLDALLSRGSPPTGSSTNRNGHLAGSTPPRSRRTSPLELRRRAIVSADDAARWCDAIARELRGGSTLMFAVVRAERPDSIEKYASEVLFSIERGRHLLQGLAELAPAPNDNPHLALAATVLLNVARHGGPAAEPIDRAATALRARATDEAERATQSAQARMSALVMTLLPMVMLSVMVATSPSVRHSLATPIGAGVVAVGACFNGVGWLWMQRIVNGGGA